MTTHIFSFVVEGCPVPKQRATPLKGGRVFTPQATRDYMTRVRGICLLKRPPRWLIMGRFAVHLKVFVPDRRKRDMDNIEKSVWDGMKGVAFADDHQIDDSSKRRFIDKARPRVEVTVKRVLA